MKRLLICLLMVISSAAYAQECNSMWPYMFGEFADAKIYFIDGQVANRKVNVHYQESQLHFLDKGVIKHTDGSKIRSVSVGDDNFIYIEGALIKVEAAEESGFVGTITLIDLNKLNEATGAYGTTSNVSSTRELTSMEEIGGTSTNTNHMELSRNRESGRTLYLEEVRYLVLSNTKYKATRSSVNRMLSKESKKAFKDFEKKMNINWDDPQSLLQVVDFLNENIEGEF